MARKGERNSTTQTHVQAARSGRSLPARFRNYVIAGVLVTAPIGITAWLAWQIVQFFDSSVRAIVPEGYNPEQYLPFSIPGIGLVIFVLALWLIGYATANLMGRTLIETGERVLSRMPVVRTVYGALKQIFETVLAHKSTAFRQVVLVEYPRRGLWCLAFVSGKTEGEVQNLSEDELVNIFLPTTPNPTSGFLLFVPKRDLTPLSMTVEEGIKMVVSGGIVTPPDRRSEAERSTPKIPAQSA
ncbi:MAG: DUF502 domain-containing protein [Alphaproteobacteria bacterium]|nr:DUF502 domain-containing protein [Alphaproteobacteria bacterium]MCY4317641.1 DUF502 domain-containing protein [Alphaproteobacteria bacterium]